MVMMVWWLLARELILRALEYLQLSIDLYLAGNCDLKPRHTPADSALAVW